MAFLPVIGGTSQKRWTSPSQRLEGNLPSLWLRADQGVYTGGARQFYTADKGYLNIADNAALSVPATSYTVAGWVYFDSVSGEQALVSKRTNDGGYILRLLSGTLQYTHADGSPETVDSGVTPVTGKWYFVVGWYDKTAGSMSISVDNATAVTDSTGVTDGADEAAAFTMGSEGVANFLGGRLSKWALWKRTLTTAEKTWLYNTGNGRVYGELGVAATDGSDLLTSLSAYWNLNEVSGTSNAIDAHSTNDLTPTFAELLTNTGFETAGGGGADVFGSWTEATAGTGTVVDEGTIVDAGTHSAKLVGTDTSNYAEVYQSVLTVGHRYTYSVRARYDTSGNASIYVGNAARTTLTLTGSFATYSGTVTCVGGTGLILDAGFGTNSAVTVYFDTVSVKAVDIPAADGPESEIAADSVGSNHGVLTGFGSSVETAWSSDQPTPIAALVDGSLAFDGTDDYVSIADPVALASDFTVAAWFKRTSGTGRNERIFSFVEGGGTDGFNLILDDATGKYGAVLRRSGSNVVDQLTYGAFTSGSWVHIAYVVSGSTGTFYLDGAAVATDGAATISVGATNGYRIGSRSDGIATTFVFGNLADARIYNTALSAANVASLYAGTDYRTGLTAQWKLDDGPQSGIADGDPVIRWTSIEGGYHDFEQATASKRPLYVASAINSKPGIDFDGTDDLLVKSSAFLTGTAGTIIIVYRADAMASDTSLFGSGDEGGTAEFFTVYANVNASGNKFGFQHGGVVYGGGNTGVVINTNYVGVLASNGSTWTERLNGTAQTVTMGGGSNVGDWWDDIAGSDNVHIGALKRSSETLFFSGKIAEIIVYPINLSSASIAKISAYTQARYNTAA